MNSLFDVDNSSDSEDCDYEPPAGEISSDDEELLPPSEGEKEVKRQSRTREGNLITLFKTGCNSAEEIKVESSTVDEKKKADDVYKSFLDEVAAEMKDAKNESMSSGISCSESTASSPILLNSDKNSCHSSTANTPEKLVESVKQTVPENCRTINSLNSDSTSIPDSKTEKTPPSIIPATSTSVKRKGLDSILGNILNKKQKMTTLTKSLMDWKNFKEEEGIEEDLASFNRGKGGFIERKRFLERSDVRSFEIERDMRLTKRQTKKDL